MIPDAEIKARVLRAKVGELESRVKEGASSHFSLTETDQLRADIALVADAVADVIEYIVAVNKARP